MSKKDIIKLIKNSDVPCIGLFVLAAVAGIVLILSLHRLWFF
ncbi:MULTISPECIES: hypothetical protein [Salinimicrobium]|nr:MULTISPECIES: hypothetical protein [Salinimicrobium]MCY2685889.1 hypothetical protein [Salinimicrobium sp. TH3]